MLATDFTEEGPIKYFDFMSQMRPTFPVGVCGRDPAMGYLQIPIMQPGYVPKLVFIDPNRTIRAQFTGEDAFFRDEDRNVRAKLDEILAASKPNRAKAAKPAARK